MQVENVASHLVRMAETAPNQPAIHFPIRGVNPAGPSEHQTITFGELNADSDSLAAGLSRLGVSEGLRVAMMVPPSPDFVSLTFALLKLGAVPVLIDAGMGLRNLGKCLAESAPAAFIGIPKAHVARRIFGWARKSIRLTVNVGRRRGFCTASLPKCRLLPPGTIATPTPSSDQTAAILFTSGSTGIAKGVVYTHGIFEAQIEHLRRAYGIERGEVDLCTFPLFALFAPALGMTSVIPDMNPSRPARIDPLKVLSQARQFRATNLFGSPAVIRRLGELAMGGEDDRRLNAAGLASLKRIVSAGAPASPRDLERLARLLPAGVQIHTPYGATEALPVATIGSEEILGDTRWLTEQGRGVCVGRPIPGITVHIIPIHDEPIPRWSESLELPPGEIGEWVVRGRIVTREYFHRPEATRLAKITDPHTGEILHRMGDVGYRDEQGRLWFCGRKSHRVSTPWGVLFTDQVEPIFNTIAGVARSALVSVERGGIEYPVLCVELAAGSRNDGWHGMVKEMRDAAKRFSHTARIDTFLKFPASFPMDVRHNSKIFREKLALWADQTLGKRWSPADNHKE